MIGRGREDIDANWKALVKVSNDEVTGKHKFQWLNEGERNAGHKVKKAKEKDGKRQELDDGFQLAGVRERHGARQKTPEKNADTFLLIDDTFKDRDGGTAPTRKDIQANQEGVALVYGQSMISSMVARAKVSPCPRVSCHRLAEVSCHSAEVKGRQTGR